MRLSSIFFREKTNVAKKETIAFNAPGIYYPPYGKTTFLMQGQGTPGNYSSGGNYAGTNPPSGGNYAGTNPSTPGNAYWSNYVTLIQSGATYTYTSYGTSSSTPSPTSFYFTYGGGYYFSESYSYISGNPPVPGNPYYNPYYPGNPYYNPYYPGNPYYNPYYPGNPYYNPYYTGTASPSNTVLGVTLPGGSADSAAPVVGYVPVTVDFTNAGVPVSVPSGGYVKIQNN